MKKSFVLYFDAYPCLEWLPADQRGELFSALFEYARETAEGRMEMGPVLERHPDMTPVTRMAFAFIGETIRRDTEKWREKHERYRQAAQQRAVFSGDSTVGRLRFPGGGATLGTR